MKECRTRIFRLLSLGGKYEICPERSPASIVCSMHCLDVPSSASGGPQSSTTLHWFYYRHSSRSVGRRGSQCIGGPHRQRQRTEVHCPDGFVRPLCIACLASQHIRHPR